MSLLDDVSIVVTPNGYKAGELYAVIPNPVYGEEEVVNGDFSDGLTGWDKSPEATLSVTNDQLDIQSLGGSGEYGYAFSTINFIAGKTYVIDLDVISTNVSIHIRVGASADFNANPDNIWGSGDIGIGSHSIIWVATNNYTYLGIGGRNDVTTLVIDNVSVKEVITASADMDVTRATAATRVDESGLVNYAEIVGSELAICGDFECASPLTGWTVNSDGAISIDSGKLKVLNVTNRGRSFRTYTGLTIGKTYKAFVNNTGGAGGFTHITSGTANNNITLNAPFFFVAGATTAEFQCGVNSTTVNSFTFFDNISLIENARDNVPRIDYTGGGCPHILAEPQRTNLVTDSVDVDTYFTNQVDATVTNNYGTSPTGENNSTRVQWADSTSFIYRAESVSTDTSASIFVKGTSGETVMFGFGGNVTTGDIYTFDGSWQRIIFTGSAGTTIFLSSYGGATATDFEVFGLQVEEGSYSTSYIPTSGSTVTRNQDIFTRDGIGSLINSTEGVLFAEVEFNQTGITNGLFAISDGTFNNLLMLRYSPTNKLQIESTGGVNIIESSARASGNYKIAVKYDSTGVELWVSGSKVIETSTQSTMSGINQLMLGKSPYGNIVGCKVKQLQVYKTALTDEQLLQLTGESGTDFYESYAEMASALTYTIQ